MIPISKEAFSKIAIYIPLSLEEDIVKSLLKAKRIGSTTFEAKKEFIDENRKPHPIQYRHRKR